MFTWFRKFFTEEERFLQVTRKFPHYARFAVAFIGWLVQRGDIPTYIPGGGQKYGPLIMIAALLIRAGEFNNDSHHKIEEE
jgi:hypothetical protein